MASVAQLNEVADGFGGEFEVLSSNQVTGELGEGFTGGESGVASSNQVVVGTEGVGGQFGVFPSNQSISGEIGVASVDRFVREPEGLGGENTAASAIHLKGEAGALESETRETSVNHEIEESGALESENRATSVNHETEEAGAPESEIRATSVNCETNEAGASESEIRATSVNRETEEAGAPESEIWATSVNLETKEAGPSESEVKATFVNLETEEAGTSESEIRATSVNHETEEEGASTREIRVTSVNRETEEAEAPESEIRATSVNLETEEAGASESEIRATSMNLETEEAGASESEIRVTSVNHETEVEGASTREIRVTSVNRETEEAGALDSEIREVPVNIVTEEAEAATCSEIKLLSTGQTMGEPAGMGGEIGVASAVLMNDSGSGSGKIEIASANEVNGEPGCWVCEVGVASTTKMNGKPEQIGGIGIVSANQLNGELGDANGESGVASMNQMNAEPVGMGDERGVASTNQKNVEPVSVGGENYVASVNQINGQPRNEHNSFGVASANQENGEPGGRSGEIWMASANQLNEEPGGEIGLASANQVIEQPGGESRSASANQANGEPGSGGGETQVASSNPVNGVSGRVGGEPGVGEKHRWVETQVYRRRPKGVKNKGVLSDLTAEPAAKTIICNANGSQKNKIIEVSTQQSNLNHNNDHHNGSKAVESDNANFKQIQPETAGEVISNKGLSSARMSGATPILADPPVTNGALRPPDCANDSRVKINLAFTAKPELRELKRKFENELYSVRKAMKRIDGGREEVVPEFFHPVVNSSMLPNGARSNGFATRVYSGTRSLGHVPYKPNIRPFNQLRVSVVDSVHGMVDSIEREKRTPKANQFYRNSEFLLANDKFPPPESNKKSKSSGKKSSGGEFGFGVGSKVYKSCSALLEKMMKHKHGWVFNAPVDVKGLGLNDYFLIIKNPMDLGTVKAKLIKYWYKSPMEFAEDVRLTFHNAMLYNPKGHDVHIMAETLLKIFEGKWPDIEVKYLRELRMAVEPDLGCPTPTSRITNPFQSSAFPPLETRVFNRSESMPHPFNPKPRTLTPAPSFRTPALTKPKANDVNKRDMTYGEKQKLSTNLQSLPPEKLDGVIQIIKKRSTALSQNDDEIEVDIDSVDTETLWELDRFVTNYKKSLSKNRRKAELANQMRAEARQAAEKIATQPLPPKESTAGYGNATLSLPPHQNDPAANASGSSSSSSSSSSGSSSSDSDSDSSSEESDGGGSPGT